MATFKLKMDDTVVAEMKLVSSLAKSLGGKELSREYDRIIKNTVIMPLVDAGRADAFAQGSHAARVAPTIRGRIKTLSLGSPRIPYWYGAVFGGQKAAKVWYVHRSKNGKKYAVNRKTTMQFRPHKGKEGYILFPVWDRLDAKLTADLAAQTAQFVRDRL